MTEQEKPIAIIIPSWDPNEPRFIVEECPKCSDDRQFKNKKCVYNQRLGFCYSVDEIVEVLNNTELEDENQQLKQELFESEKEHILETYADNPVRRDEKIDSLKQEFKERFGVDFE